MCRSVDSDAAAESLGPVFKTLEKELREGGLKGLTPIERMEPADGMAVCKIQICQQKARLTLCLQLPDEVSQVVASRAGVILSAQTVGCKESLGKASSHRCLRS